MWSFKKQPEKPEEQKLIEPKTLSTAWPFDGRAWTNGWRFGVHEFEPGVGIGSRLLVQAEDGKLTLTLQLTIGEDDPELGYWHEKMYITGITKVVDISDWPTVEQLKALWNRENVGS